MCYFMQNSMQGIHFNKQVPTFSHFSPIYGLSPKKEALEPPIIKAKNEKLFWNKYEAFLFQYLQ